MLKKLRKLKFIINRKAATALEFAIVSPILILMIFASIEVNTVMAASAVLESAVRMASRAGITGYTPAGMTRDQYVRQVVEQNLLFLDRNRLVFQTLVYDSFANIGRPEPYTDANHNGQYNIGEVYSDVNLNGHWDSDMGASGSGGADAIVVYKVTYPWQIITPVLTRFFGTNGAFNLTASMVVKNEPYD